ncbi:MAG: serine/threonine protein kinase [Candidatus Obscuribacterales bacterium]|nr:serine/threonine protein kinase [Candidatus Obscuribacterales bacterium]
MSQINPADNIELDALDAIELRVAEPEEASSLERKVKKNAFSKPFCINNHESLVTLAIVLIGVIIIPAAWVQTGPFVQVLLSVIGKILKASGLTVYAVLGWGLWLYPLATYIIFNRLISWLNGFSQANQVDLSNEGLTVKWLSEQSKKLKWTDITSVFLFRPAHTMLPERWLVGFGTADARPVNIRLPVIQMYGADLIRLLQENCKWASIDPDLIELLEPAIQDSHTELWLKSLNIAPKESELMPLFPGASLQNGRYLILSRVGVGGQGTAYLAKDSETGQELVVKENLFPVFVDADVREQAEDRFRNEVKLLSRLNHEQVVRMRDSFVEGHRGYLVLDYIEGLSLRQVVKKQGALSEAEVLRLAGQMAQILAYLHSLSPPVVHRDFTPDNLMLDKDNSLVLIDFNVARELESNKTATIVGKHAYIAPEQFRGETDCRSDIYSLGACLAFLLNGGDPEPISQTHPKESMPELSEKIDRLVAKATEIDAVNRFQSAAEIEEFLQS